MAGLVTSMSAVAPTTQSATVSSNVPNPPAVLCTDLDGFPVAARQVTFSVTAGGGSIVGGSALTGVDGIARLTSWTLGPGVGTNTVVASLPGAAGIPSITFTATGTAVVATKITAASPTNQQAVVGSLVTTPRVLVTGAGGVPVAGVQVSFAVTAGGGSLTDSGFALVSYTDAAGIAAPALWRLGSTPGTNTVTATVNGLVGSPVTFNATAVSAGATTIAANSTRHQSAQVGTNVSSPPSVKVTDANGLAVAGVTVSFAVATGGGSVSPASVVTNGSGIATLTSWTVGTTEDIDSDSVTASVPGLTGSPVTFVATTTPGAPGTGVTPTQIAANSSTSQSGQVGTKVTAPPSVIVRDSGSVAVPGVTVVFAVTAGGGQISSTTVATNGSGIATLGQWVLGAVPGANTVTASVEGLTGSPVTFDATATAGTGQLYAGTYQDVLYVASVDKLYASGGARTTAAGTDNVVRVFDGRTRTHLHDIVVGTGPQGMVEANGKVYVALSGGNIAVISTATDTLSSTITIAGTWSRGVYVPTTDRVIFVQNATGAVIQVNPSTDTQSTLVGSVGQVGLVAYAPTNDRLYIGTNANAILVVNPATGATVTTITAGSTLTLSTAACFAYAPTSPEGLYVTAVNSGTTRRVAVITPSTNSLRGYIAVGTTTANGVTAQGRYMAETDKLYLLRAEIGTPTRSSILTINPATDTLEREDLSPLAGAVRLNGIQPAHRSLWLMNGGVGQGLVLWNAVTRGPTVRTLITDSQVEDPQVTVENATPFAAGDLVVVRRNAEGSYRVKLEDPARIAALDGIRREMLAPDDTVRGERNLVLNPWARSWTSGYAAPGWALPSGYQSHWYDRDSLAWLEAVGAVHGTQSGTLTSLTVRNLPPGSVLLPGDHLTSHGVAVGGRAVVAGDGTVTIPLNATLTSQTDGATVIIRRPPVPEWFTAAGGPAMAARTPGVTSVEGGVDFVAPYYDGLTTLWCSVEVGLWAAVGSIVPSSRLALITREGSSTVATTPSADTVPLVGPSTLQTYILSYRHTLVAPTVVSLRARLDLSGATGGDAASIYIRRFQATLGPEADIQPPFEYNAGYGALYHSSQRALRDRAEGFVQYTCIAEESRIDAPLVVGGDVDLRHPTRGLVATPRLLKITRTIEPGAKASDTPVIELDNLPPSLTRRLSSSGVS